jgi:antiviral helicase SKI2
MMIEVGLPCVQTRREQRNFSLPTDAESFALQNVNLTLVDVVYDWARGVSFADITSTTLVPEGSIVRCITRLDELCREVRNAARIIGNPSLYRKMEQASEAIKRDIVFAGSLYLV